MTGIRVWRAQSAHYIFCLLSSVFWLLKEVRSHAIAKQLSDGAPTVCMHAVSGSISLPSRGSFRLSLTVLVHYRSITSI